MKICTKYENKDDRPRLAIRLAKQFTGKRIEDIYLKYK